MRRSMMQLSFVYLALFFQGLPCHRAFFLKATSRLRPVSTRTATRGATTKQSLSSSASASTSAATETFCDYLAESLRNQSFTSFTLQGPKGMPQDPTVVRGRIKRVQGRVIELASKNTKAKRRCVQVTYKFHGATDVAKNYDQENLMDKVVRPLLSGMSVVDSEWGASVSSRIGTSAHASLQGAHLETVTQQVEYQAAYGKKERLVVHKAKTNKGDESSLSSKTLALAHDRVKQRPLSPTHAVLPALGLTDTNGRVKPGKKAKLVQAQKFVEIVSRLIEQQQQQSTKKLRIFDMGCGRGYLTFCLHAHLMQDDTKQSVETFGIDVRPKLVKDMNALSRKMEFDGLSFLEGTIEEYMLADNRIDDNNADDDSSLKVWLALHACDTATDDALWSGIVQQASIIVVAPCCHKELRPQLDRAMSKDAVLRHGIFRQRWAATLTDSMRVMLLEMAGYQAQVIEFVQSADTPQNVMITAVKKRGAIKQPAVDEFRTRLVQLAQSYGVEHHALATWMGETLDQNESTTRDDLQPTTNQMPPL